MNMRDSEIKLGDEVKDKISGFQGIVTADALFVAGCRRIRVQSQKLHDGEPVKGHWFDEPNLQMVKKNALPPTYKQPKQTVKLGDRIEDKITGFKGIAVARTIFYAAPPDITVAPEALEDGTKLKDPYAFNENQLKVVKKQKEKEPTNKPTGGPQQPAKRAW